MSPASQAIADVTFIVPTLRRPDFLTRCLRAIAGQSLPVKEVLVGIRADDTVSGPALHEFKDRLNLRAVEARGVGVVGSMNSCLREAQATYVGLLDDDVELPPQWVATMVRHLESDPAALGVGGRDFLQDHPEMRRTEPLVHDVGRVHWYGRITGNHHRGSGQLRRVQVLRGSNCLFRGDFLREIGFESKLRGRGAQVNWELAIALEALRRRRPLLYDPTLEVLHHVAPRHDSDQVHRGRFVAEGISDIAFNETFVTKAHAPALAMVPLIGWQFLVGTRTCPGLLNVLRISLAREPHVWSRTVTTLRARVAALRAN